MNERETAQPLTAEEERDWRFVISPMQTLHGMRWGDEAIRRMFATLDAARAGDEGLTAGHEKFIEDEAVAAFYRAHINHVYHSQKGRDTALARRDAAESWRVPVRAAVKAVLAALRATDTEERG